MDEIYAIIRTDLDYHPDYIRHYLSNDMPTAPHDNFPDNIHRHLWVKPGSLGGDSWFALGELSNGSFFFLIADSARGFTDHRRSGMALWVTYNFPRIIRELMDEPIYRRYIAETVVEREAPFFEPSSSPSHGRISQREQDIINAWEDTRPVEPPTETYCGYACDGRCAVCDGRGTYDHADEI
jgi:hypothetical protein